MKGWFGYAERRKECVGWDLVCWPFVLCSDEVLMLETANTLLTAFSKSTSTFRWYSLFNRYRPALVLTGTSIPLSSLMSATVRLRDMRTSWTHLFPLVYSLERKKAVNTFTTCTASVYAWTRMCKEMHSPVWAEWVPNAFLCSHVSAP